MITSFTSSVAPSEALLLDDTYRSEIKMPEESTKHFH